MGEEKALGCVNLVMPRGGVPWAVTVSRRGLALSQSLQCCQRIEGS